MRRVVVTGLGIVSSLGNNIEEVTTSLRNGTSGITYCDEYEMGFRIYSWLNRTKSEYVDRKVLPSWGTVQPTLILLCNKLSKTRGSKKDQVSNDKTGLIIGSGGPSTSNMMTASI